MSLLAMLKGLPKFRAAVASADMRPVLPSLSSAAEGGTTAAAPAQPIQAFANAQKSNDEKVALLKAEEVEAVAKGNAAFQSLAAERRSLADSNANQQMLPPAQTKQRAAQLGAGLQASQQRSQQTRVGKQQESAQSPPK